MSPLQDKLHHLLADKTPTWSSDGLRATTGDALWLTHAGPLDATTLLDLYVPLAETIHVTLLHEGPLTVAALKWAKRLEIALVDAATVAVPDAPPVPGVPTVPAVPTVPDVPAVREVPKVPTVPTVPSAPPVLTVPAVPSVPAVPDAPAVLPDPVGPPALPAPEALPLLAAHVATVDGTAPGVGFVVAPSAQAPRSARAVVTEPALPWDVDVLVAEPVAAHVAVGELLAFPWNSVESLASRAAEEDEHHEVMAGSPRRVPLLDHPTSFIAPQGPNWGLPWPRPVAQADMVARADPSVWHGPERLAAMREDLEKAGAPSFGAAKPDGSAWLRKITDAG
jgi:hypothetical protein